MRVTEIFTALVVGTAVVAASPSPLEARGSGGLVLNPGNHYGAPIPPWSRGCHPGWYFGNHPERHPKLIHLYKKICKHVKHFPHALRCPPADPPTPPPSDGYTHTFSNLTGATQAGDYITFGLVDTVDDCKAMCNSVTGCGFANTYRDVNGKGGSPQLTCSLFSGCHTAAEATNVGGQTQPDGSVNYITNSDGWCKA